MKKVTVFLLTFAMGDAFAAGETITDGTVGGVQNFGSNSFVVPQSLGKTVGNNLFHSFSEFNVNTGQTATFTGSNNLQNVISRVTGGNVSNIDGTIKSEVGNADFYFINPAGVIFGQNANIDVPAAFHVSTADQLTLKDGTIFSAITPNGSDLSSANPAEFGFLGASTKHNGLLAINGSQLTVKPNQTIDFVAGNIEIKSTETQTTQLNAESGVIRLVAMQGAGKVSVDTISLPTQKPTEQNAGNIAVDGRTDSQNPDHIRLDTRGNGGGNFSLWGNDTQFFKSNVWSDNTGLESPAQKKVNVIANLFLLDDSSLSFNSYNSPNSGDAGDVNVQAETLNLINHSEIASHTWSTGKAGTVTVSADNLKIDGGGSSIASNANGGSGDAGSVNVKAKNIDLLNGGGISSNTDAGGNAGTITIETSNLNIERNRSAIVSDAHEGSHGDAGSVKVTADYIKIDAVAGILSSTFGEGKAGKIEVNAKTLEMFDNGTISSKTAAGGKAGEVLVVADNLKIDGNKTDIDSNSVERHDQADNTPVGDAGNVTVTTKNAVISNGGKISSDTNRNGKAGTVKVTADDLKIDNPNSGISSASNSEYSSGKTGDVFVFANNSIQIINGGSINAKNEAVVNDTSQIIPSKVIVTAPEISLQNGGGISTNSSGNVSASNIEINSAKNLLVNASLITTTAKSGNGGSITVDGKNALISLKDSGFITTVKTADGNGGNININSDILLMDSAVIQANAESGNGGKINLNINALIPNGNMLIKSRKQLEWQPKFGFNLIQAASASGLNGTINSSAPQLNLSGVLANFGKPQFESNLIEQNACDENDGSSLTRVGNGGLPRNRSELSF